MTRPLRILATTIALAAAMNWTGAAHSGDGDYENEDRGPVYFGLVADARGKAIADAQVVIKAKDHEPLLLKTTTLGLYRSHVAKDVRPEDIEVSCRKDGYRTTRVVRRGQQTNCTLEP